jgi:hypothetical protein
VDLRVWWLRGSIALLLAGCVSIVFWQQLLNVAVFIGESDRLNSYLNIRLAEYDSLRAYGYVTAWDPSMFGGFTLAALHWMNPGADPVAWFLQIFSRDNVFQALGYVSILSVLAACVTAYLYISALVGRGLPAAAGAVCYGLSVFSIHRMAQVDNAHLTVVLMPVAMLAIRRSEAGNCLRPFGVLLATLAALAYWGFLQEVAYAYCFLACYALYRAAAPLGRNWRAGLPPLAVFGLAAAISLLVASPRILTVRYELNNLSRATGLHYYGYGQLLRFFHEGIYGRYFGEGQSLGHSMNLNEGLQLVSSTALSMFVCLGILRPTRRLELVGGLAFFSMLLALHPIHFSTHFFHDSFTLPTSSIFLYFIALSLLLALLRWTQLFLGLGTSLGRLLPAHPRPTDTVFHLFAVVALLGLVLTLEGYQIVYFLFARQDFTHTRLSGLIILPLCTLFSVYLAELRDLPLFEESARPGASRRFQLTALVATAAAVAWLVHGPLVDHLVPLDAFKSSYDDNALSPTTIVRVSLTAIFLGSFLAWAVASKTARSLDRRLLPTLLVATFAIAETVTYAHLKVDGPQTWTYPVPFRTFDYLNVPSAVLRPPTPERLAKFASRLEIDAYRSVLVSERSAYAGVKTPHIAEFWRARMIGGYGTGVPKRLADLPWPDGVRSLRAIELNSMQDIEPKLLALLNVKYILVATPDLYFDVASSNSIIDRRNILTLGGVTYAGEVVDIDGITFGLLRNPVEPLPRQFLVETVTGVPRAPDWVENIDSKTQRPDAVIADVGSLKTHAFAEHFAGTRRFDAEGRLDVSYKGEIIDVRVNRSEQPRFIVINERYHPGWRADAGDTELPVLPTNAVMMGIEIPPGVDRIRLRFVPFSATEEALLLRLLALVSLCAAVGALWWLDVRSMGRYSASSTHDRSVGR